MTHPLFTEAELAEHEAVVSSPLPETPDWVKELDNDPGYHEWMSIMDRGRELEEL